MRPVRAFPSLGRWRFSISSRAGGADVGGSQILDWSARRSDANTLGSVRPSYSAVCHVADGRYLLRNLRSPSGAHSAAGFFVASAAQRRLADAAIGALAAVMFAVVAGAVFLIGATLVSRS
jgi:hypothetical protein